MFFFGIFKEIYCTPAFWDGQNEPIPMSRIDDSAGAFAWPLSERLRSSFFAHFFSVESPTGLMV